MAVNTRTAEPAKVVAPLGFRAGAAKAGVKTGLAERLDVASTGVIGWQLPIERITKAIAEIEPTETAFPDFARAIMTTDTKPKQVVAANTDGSGKVIRAIGTAKGAGMIHPNMATLLSFVVTDANIPLSALREMAKRIADRTFNAISVDGDTSTNDTFLILANGAAGSPTSDAALASAETFLLKICEQLARQIVADGEGVTKVFEVRVSGAVNDDDAKKAARTIATANLVKTAIHGADPNWGRIIAAAGRSGARVDDRRASIRIGDVDVFKEGTPLRFDPHAVRR